MQFTFHVCVVSMDCMGYGCEHVLIKLSLSSCRLAWPEGAPNKKAVKAVKKLANLRRLILEHGDSSAVPYLDPLVDLLTALLR